MDMSLPGNLVEFMNWYMSYTLTWKPDYEPRSSHTYQLSGPAAECRGLGSPAGLCRILEMICAG